MQTPIGTTPDPRPQPADLPQTTSAPRSRGYGWLALLGGGPLFWVSLWLMPELNRDFWHDPVVHVMIATSAALLGVFLALLVLRAAGRSWDGRIFLIGLGFLSVASLLLIHAVGTPSVLMSGRLAATAWSALLCLVVGSIFFALSSLDLSAALNHWLMQRVRLWLVLYLLAWVAYSLTFLVLIPAAAAEPAAPASPAELVSPQDHPAPQAGAGADAPSGYGDYGVAAPGTSGELIAALRAFPPTPPPPVRLALSIFGLACFALAIMRHWLLYRRAPSPAALSIICGIGLFAEALITQLLFPRTYTLAFWFSHAMEIIGFGVIGYAVLGAYGRGQDGLSLLESLFLTGTRSRLQAEYARSMDALVEVLSRGERPPPELLQALRGRLGMAESQIAVFEHSAAAVAQERQQRREMERLNATLHQLEQDKNQLMQMVVHDLKNPLTALVGFLELLRLDHLSDDQRMLVESALRSGKNLAGLISDLLDVGRIEEGHLELESSLLSPRDLLEDCASEMRGWIAQEDRHIQIEISPDVPLLRADLRLMQRVMLNLISNAIKHTPAGTSIILRAYRDPSVVSDAAARLVIAVEDNGPGIPPEYLERIFDKFGRVGGEHHPRQDSTGLGLTFCRLAVEAHGGSIDVSSVLGQGTTFHIRLPGV